MNQGDLCAAEIEYEDGSGKKVRPVIILMSCSDGDFVVLHSRGSPKKQHAKRLVMEIEISATRYRKAWQDGFEQFSHFYYINIKKIHASKMRNSYGPLHKEHLAIIRSALKEFFPD